MELIYQNDFVKDYPEWNINEANEDWQCPNHLADYTLWLQNKIKNLGERSEPPYPLLCEVGKLIKLYDDHIDLIINNFQNAAEYAEKYNWSLDNNDKNEMLESLTKVKAHKEMLRVVFKIK